MPSKKAALITLHGMGETKKKYAKGLIGEIRARLNHQEFAELSIQTVFYQEELQKNEDKVLKRTNQEFALSFDGLRKFLLFGFGDAAGLEANKEDAKSAYEVAQTHVAQALLKARAEMGGDGPIVVIAQSLGCQVFSCFIYDSQCEQVHNRRPPAGIWQSPEIMRACLGLTPSPQELAFMRGGTMRALLTTGCNIAIFVAAHDPIEPICSPRHDFEWHNYFDPQDVLGWPLGPLSDGYQQLVVDHSVNVGGILKAWNPLSHTSYWTDANIVDPLVAQLQRALHS